jgi:hypothetical protein
VTTAGANLATGIPVSLAPVDVGHLASLFRRWPTVSGAIGEVQKRRDGVPDQVRANSVGSIVAHEAIVVAPSRAFFRAVEPEAERNNASRAAAGRQMRKFFSDERWVRIALCFDPAWIAKAGRLRYKER